MYTVGELISSSTSEAFAWTAVLCCLEKIILVLNWSSVSIEATPPLFNGVWGWRATWHPHHARFNPDWGLWISKSNFILRIWYTKARKCWVTLATIQYLRNAEYLAHISEDACLKATDPCEGWHVVTVLQRLVTRDILHLADNLCMTKTMCMLCLYVKWVCFKALFFV